MTQPILPISLERIHQHAQLPVKLAELSHVDRDSALSLLQDWGEGKRTIKSLWEEIHLQLEHTSVS